MPGMKQSTIKRVIRRKLDDWIRSIESEVVRDVVRESAIVSGGCIASMLAEDKVNDYDVYFTSKSAALAVANYYVDKFNASNGKLPTTSAAPYNPVVKEEARMNVRGEIEDRVVIYVKSAGAASEAPAEYKYFETRPEAEADEFVESLHSADDLLQDFEKSPLEGVEGLYKAVKEGKEKYRPVFFSENAITLSDRVQLIVRFYGEPGEILDNYDYAHCMCWYSYSTDHISVHEDALESILSKALIYKGSLYPVASVFRMRKFLSRGWRITAGQILKMLMQISKIDLEDPIVLREQLIGVDQAYMSQLLAELQSLDHKRVDTVYLAKLIDEIFE